MVLAADRARYAGEHHEGVARYIDVNILEVILAGAANLHAIGRPRMPLIGGRRSRVNILALQFSLPALYARAACGSSQSGNR